MGFTKVFWVDAMTLITNYEKKILSVRLQLFDTSGLGYSSISRDHFVQDPSLLSRVDYRVIVQVSPFILFDLIPSCFYDAWIALSCLMPLILQPVIHDLEGYIVSLHQLKYL